MPYLQIYVAASFSVKTSFYLSSSHQGRIIEPEFCFKKSFLAWGIG